MCFLDLPRRDQRPDAARGHGLAVDLDQGHDSGLEIVTRLQHRQLAWCREALAATPAARRLLDGGRSPLAGSVQRQPQLAEALCRIAEHGVEDFYGGAIAAAIVADMRRHGGLVDAGDLEAVGAPAEREPLTLRYRGHAVITIPPPGGGVELALALKLLEALSADRADDARWHALLACATHGAFAGISLASGPCTNLLDVHLSAVLPVMRMT